MSRGTRRALHRVCLTERRPSAPEQNLEHEFAAEVGKKHEEAAGDDPAKRDAASPAIAPAAPEQRADGEPAEHRKHDLVREGEGLAEELLGEHHAARERYRQQHEADGDEPEEKPLE